MFDKPLNITERFIKEKFARNPEIADANIKALHAGWNYGDNTEIFTTQFKVAAAKLPAGKIQEHYR